MEDMPRKLPLHVTRQKKGDKWYYYHRVGKGPRISLPAPNHPDFKEAHKAAELGLPAPKKRAAEDARSFRWLVSRYRESSSWSVFSPATKKQRENIFVHLIDAIGNEDFRDVDRANISKAMEKRRDTPAQANVMLKTLKGLFSWAVKNNHLDVNPTSDVEWINYKTDGFPAWSMADVKLFCHRWPVGTMQRLAMELGLITGLRRSDVHVIGRQHMRGNVLSVKTAKTGEEVSIEIPERVLIIIEATPRKGLHFIEGAYGSPFTVESFGNWFRDACRAAGLADKNMHGVRKLAATLAAEGGATAHELMAQFGWAKIKQAEHYTKKADRKRLGVTSSRLVAEQIEAALAPTGNSELGKTSENTNKSKA